MDFFCLFFLAYFRCYKVTWRRMSRKAKIRNYMLLVVFIICTADLIYSITNDSYPYLTNLLRPVVVLIFLS